MNAHAKVEAVSRADQLVDLIRENIRAFNASPRQGYNPLDAHRAALAEDMSWQACTSPAAAVLKLCLVYSEASAAFTHLENDQHRRGVDDNISRQIGTLIRWIDRQFGVTPDAAREYYFPEYSERRAWDREAKDDTVVLP